MKPSHDEMLLDLSGMIRLFGKRPDKNLRGKRTNLDFVQELWSDEELQVINETLFNDSEPTGINVNDLL